MASAPALAAIAADVLWCIGLGLLLAVLRDAAALLLGEGRALCFVLDVAAFALAAVLLTGFAAGVSASGVARWYMIAAAAGGALAWHWGVSGALHAVLRGTARGLLFPFRLVSHRLVRPCKARLRTYLKVKKQEKKPKLTKKAKKPLQTPEKILYN